MSRPVISPRAVADIDDILRCISQDNPAAALRLLDRLEASSMRLAERPGIGVRVHVVGAYLILYRADRQTVVVARYVHGAQRIARQDI